MGTRGLIGFIIRAKRHGIFNTSDSNPDCLGQSLVSFILSLKPEDYATMNRLLGEITVSALSRPHYGMYFSLPPERT
jgi:hypothetical protein